MIVVATSSANQCHYCVVAHGAILRIRAKNPQIADQIAVNYRKADITPRQRAMLDFAMKVSAEADKISEQDFADTRRPRFQRRRHLGHRRDLGVLRAVEPDGQRHRHASERRILHDGTSAEVRRLQGVIALLDWSEIVLRLGAATLAGGSDRPQSRSARQADRVANPWAGRPRDRNASWCWQPRPATPRTFPDATSRIIQGILTGIGFLGAGVIVHRENRSRVQGLTSAACTWLTACVGIICGAGSLADRGRRPCDHIYGAALRRPGRATAASCARRQGHSLRKTRHPLSAGEMAVRGRSGTVAMTGSMSRNRFRMRAMRTLFVRQALRSDTIGIECRGSGSDEKPAASRDG